MRRVLTTTIAAISLGLAAPALAGDSADQADRNLPRASTPDSVDELNPSVAKKARLLLSGYHGLPTKQQLEKEIPNTRHVLFAYAQDAQVFPLYRKRALRALGYYADPQVESLYETMVSDETTEPMIRHALIGLLGEHFGAAGVPTIAPFLSHDDVQFRLTAVEALRKIDDEAALDALREAKKSESNEIVRRRLEEATRIVK